jgi:hypothetical protein
MLLQTLNIDVLLNESIRLIFPNSVINEGICLVESSRLVGRSNISGLSTLESSVHINLNLNN